MTGPKSTADEWPQGGTMMCDESHGFSTKELLSYAEYLEMRTNKLMFFSSTEERQSQKLL